jgi:hypothetical protein
MRSHGITIEIECEGFVASRRFNTEERKVEVQSEVRFYRYNTNQ